MLHVLRHVTRRRQRAHTITIVVFAPSLLTMLPSYLALSSLHCASMASSSASMLLLLGLSYLLAWNVDGGTTR